MKQPIDQKILSETYRDLLAQYGELCIQKDQIIAKIKDLESKLDSLNFFAPLTVKLRQELTKEIQNKQDLSSTKNSDDNS